MLIYRLAWPRYGHGFSLLLRTARRARGLSQQALAEMSGVSRSQICNLERNENGPHSMADPQLSTVFKLAYALAVPPALLIPGVGELVGDGYVAAPGRAAELVAFPRSYVEARRAANDLRAAPDWARG